MHKIQHIRTIFLVAVITVVLVSCTKNSSEELFGYVPSSPKNVAFATITDAETDSPFTFVAQPDGLLIAYFGYTHCPDVCPTTLVAIKNARQKIGALASRVDLAMTTVDPERDTVDVLPRYLASLSDRFHALIPATLEELRQAEELFQATSSVTKTGDKIDVVHSGTAYVIDDQGNVVVEWPFGLDANSMAHDLTQLLNQKETTS